MDSGAINETIPDRKERGMLFNVYKFYVFTCRNCHFENVWMENCPAYFKPTVYGRFVDDTFLLFRTKDHVEKFKNYLKQYKYI